jgi:hypothetical protein
LAQTGYQDASVAQSSAHRSSHPADISSVRARFSLLEAMFGTGMDASLSDLIQASLMLRYNERRVG